MTRLSNMLQVFSQTRPDEVELIVACGMFERFSPIRWMPNGLLFKAVKSGEMKAVKLCFDDVAEYMLFYHVSHSCLHVNGALCLRNQPNPDLIFQAVDIIAAGHLCHKIRFMSLLRGLVRTAEHNGFELEALCMTKNLEV